MRRRKSDTTQLHILQLPSEVLIKIFNHLNGTSLARAESVCRQWRAEIRNKWNGVELWRNMCFSRGLTASLFRRPDKYRVTTWTARVKAAESGTREHSYAIGHLASTWRRMFVLYRNDICRHCLKVEKRNLYRLFGQLRLCRACRFKMPYAALLTTQARRYFKFDTDNAHVILGYTPPTSFPPGGGVLYRFTDVQKFAELKYGKEWARIRANRAKTELGIGEMKGTPLLKDI